MGWPNKKLYGLSVDPSTLGSRQVAQVPAGKAASAPIEVHKHARNGKPPEAWLANQINEATNQAVLYRTKEIFSSSGIVGILGGDLPSSAGAGDRVRWRFAFHTSTYHSKLLVAMVMHPQDSGFTRNSAARIDIYTSPTYSGSPVATVTFNHGPGPNGTTIVYGLSYLKASEQYIEGLSPDTDYYGIAYDVDNGRMVNASIMELNSMSERLNGYLPQNLTAETPILDIFRELPATIQYNLWRRSAASDFAFSTEKDGDLRVVYASPTNANDTPSNIIDMTYPATYSASQAFFRLKMTGKARQSQLTTGVPVRFCAFVSVPAATTSKICLRNSSGTIVVSITQAGAYTGWISTTAGLLPATEDDYYITQERTAGTAQIACYAVGCAEYE